MKRRALRAAGLFAVVPACLSLACDSLGLGDIAALFGSGVTVVIENASAFTAVPELYTTDSDNVFEDLVAEEDRVSNFGINGAILPNQTVTIRLPCDSDLERILLRGVEFREGNGLALGEADADVKLRKDIDFDCGDTVNIRVGGSIFNFYADVDVDHSSRDQSGDNAGDDGTDDSFADFLDDLFG
ncbi:MAG: hypothetical protein JXQ75_19560 [Phycisphaerae bacterium]|nr:hypothetical protein [Phycisphaerae bacterium]